MEEQAGMLEVSESQAERMEEPGWLLTLLSSSSRLLFCFCASLLFIETGVEPEGFDVRAHERLRETLPFVVYQPAYYKFPDDLPPLKPLDQVSVIFCVPVHSLVVLTICNICSMGRANALTASTKLGK